MKKKLLFILFIFFMIFLIGCGADKDNKNTEIEIPKFTATVLEVLDNSVLVKPSKDSNEAKSSDKIYISLKDISLSFNPLIGQTVEIFYDGIILESYPAQINSCFKIELIEN